MLRAGKAHWITVIGSVGFVLLLVVFLIPTSSPNTAANSFMSALADGDIEKLLLFSYYNGDREKLRKQWEFSVNEAGKYYVFRWRNVGVKEADDQTAAVKLMVQRNYGPESYDEKFDLPMVKVDGKWLVDVASVSRALFPAIPR